MPEKHKRVENDHKTANISGYGHLSEKSRDIIRTHLSTINIIEKIVHKSV